MSEPKPKPFKKNTQSVGWSFTSQNEFPPEFHPMMRCMIYQREKCPTTGKLHWQGAFRTNNKHGLAFSTVKTKLLINGEHFCASKGTWEDNVNYCSKKDTQVSEPVIQGNPPRFGEELVAAKTDYLRPLVEMAKSGKSMKQLCDEDGATYVRHYRALSHVSKMYSIKPYVHQLHAEDFNVPLQEFNGKTIVLIGPTKLGKTHYAMAHFKNPFLVSHIDDLANFDPEQHDGIVFDDVKLDHIPRTAQIHITDWDMPRSIHIRFTTATIPANTRKIFTCNEYPFIYDEAIDRRVERIDVLEHLVKNPKD